MGHPVCEQGWVVLEMDMSEKEMSIPSDSCGWNLLSYTADGLLDIKQRDISTGDQPVKCKFSLPLRSYDALDKILNVFEP